MNDSDTEANTNAIDSLLNYETVKYFSAEQREAERYDRSMERYEHNSVKTYTSLAVLNTGQAAHLPARFTPVQLIVAPRAPCGRKTVRASPPPHSPSAPAFQPPNV